MLPDEFKHSQDDDRTSGTSGPNPGVAAPAHEPSYPFWARPESVSLEHGISPHGPGYNAPGVPPFPPFPAFPAQFPFFGRHHHGGPPPPPPPPPPPRGPPGPPGEHPDPPLPPPPPPAPAQDPLGSFGPWRDYLENIASWTQQAVNAYSGVGEHAHGHSHHGRHFSHFDPRRGGRRGHHHEGGSDGEGPGHRGPGGPWGSRRGGWGSHRGRGGRCGHHGPPHHGFIHPAMDIISSDDAYTVTIELPGLRKDDVEISVHGRVLTVSGEFKPDTGAPKPPAPSPDPEGYPIEYTEDEEDPFIDVDDNIEKKKRKDSAILKERRVGKFKRSIDLPSWVDAEKGIKASMADGVLTITFNKGPESKAKKVNIL